MVKVRFSSEGKHFDFEAELVGEDGFNRSVDKNAVEYWPIDSELAIVSKPFIMQHALKYLLLVRPDERFKGFALLLGLDELGDLQSDFVSVCTKPEASLPADVMTFRTQISVLESRLATRSTLKHLHSLYKRGKESFASFTTLVLTECRSHVPEGTTDDSVLPNLLRIRDESVKKIFSGSITLAPYSVDDKASNSSDFEYFINLVSEDLIRQYCVLVALATSDIIINYAEFYRIGFEFLKKNPDQCPFCGQHISDTVTEHINKKHQETVAQTQRSSTLSRQRQAVNDTLSELRRRLDRCHQRNVSRLTTFLLIDSSFDQLTKILQPKHESYISSIRETIVQLQKLKRQLDQHYVAASDSLNVVQTSVQQSKEDIALIKDLGKNLIAYSSTLSTSVTSISALVPPMSDANEILKHELDSVAGTEDISLLIDLNENQKQIKKAFEIESILSGLKELRKSVDQYVGAKMLDAVTNEMTQDVMNWYRQIRTTGDPDVHFSGFDMDRTQKGDIRSRRVQIKASSYGKDMVSAVSSLSESKLNALGLCLSIATNLKPGCPFDFLFIDDPIQSWDEEHGIQFIEIVHKLIDNGKQVILFSHHKKWLEQVRTGCRSLNGLYYEITSYNKSGPVIVQKAWCSWKQRLDLVDAMLKDNTADSIRLEQAEAEIRQVIFELTAQIYLACKGTKKEPNKLNASLVSRALIECGVSNGLVDRISQTFVTTGDAHHTDSSGLRERIRRYHSWTHELAKYLEQ